MCENPSIFPNMKTISEALEIYDSTKKNKNLTRPTSMYPIPNPCSEIDISQVDMGRGFTPPTRPAQPQPIIYGNPPKEHEFNKPMFMVRLEEIESLYTKRVIITTRNKVETELKYFFKDLRKKSYIPYIDKQETSIYERIDKAIDFLLTLSRKIDKIQQDEKIYANTQHIEVVFDLQ